MKMKKNILYMSICVLLLACAQPSPLEQALVAVTENQVEPVAVPEHYRKKTSDFLKYKTARFLIENIPGRPDAYREIVADKFGAFRYYHCYSPNQWAGNVAEPDFASLLDTTIIKSMLYGGGQLLIIPLEEDIYRLRSPVNQWDARRAPVKVCRVP
jgi:hypothetical protein